MCWFFVLLILVTIILLLRSPTKETLVGLPPDIYDSFHPPQAGGPILAEAARKQDILQGGYDAQPCFYFH